MKKATLAALLTAAATALSSTAYADDNQSSTAPQYTPEEHVLLEQARALNACRNGITFQQEKKLRDKVMSDWQKNKGHSMTTEEKIMNMPVLVDEAEMQYCLNTLGIDERVVDKQLEKFIDKHGWGPFFGAMKP